MSAYAWSEKESRRTRALRRKDERELQSREAESLVESLGVGLDAQPLLLSVGEAKQRLEIPPGCAGLLIGKKGENLRSVEQRFKVTVKLEGGEDAPAGVRRGRGPRVELQHVVVTGPSPQAVAAAALELDFAAETVDIPPGAAGWVVGRGGRHLRAIQDWTGVAVLSLQRPGGGGGGEEEEEGSEALPPSGQPGDGAEGAALEADGPCWLELKGRRDQVADAKMCLEAHMGYYPVYVEMREAEEALDRDIAEAQVRFGRGGRANASSKASAPASSAAAGPPAAKPAPGRGSAKGGGAGKRAGGGAAGGSPADADAAAGRGQQRGGGRDAAVGGGPPRGAGRGSKGRGGAGSA